MTILAMGQPYLVFDDDDSLGMDEAANSSFFRMGLPDETPPLEWRYANEAEAEVWRTARKHHVTDGELEPGDWYVHNLTETTEH